MDRTDVLHPTRDGRRGLHIGLRCQDLCETNRYVEKQTQMAKTPGSTSIRHRSDTKVSDRYIPILGSLLLASKFGTFSFSVSSF